MKSLLLMALLHLSPPETQAEARSGESLAQLAQRTLGSSAAASELKALNGLKDDTLTPGMKLKLPGPERERAQKALASARHAVQADTASPRHTEAEARLREAEAHFQEARYDAAAEQADAAWNLLAERSASQATKMVVTVDNNGGTLVQAVSGRMTVEGSKGGPRTLEHGSLHVNVNEAPRPLLAAPQPTSPGDNQRLSQKAVNGALEPITISWQGVEGAERYEVVLVPAAGGDKRVLPATAPSLKVALEAGAYRWSVRALAREEQSDDSAPRGFEVAEAPAKALKLKAKPMKWK